MDDPSVAKGVRGPSHAARLLAALGIGLWAALLASTASAADEPAPVRLPPVENVRPSVDLPATMPSPERVYGASSYLTSGTTERFYGVESLPSPTSAFRPSSVFGSSTTERANEPVFRLTSLQETAPSPPPSSRKTEDGDAGDDGDSGESGKKEGDQPQTFGQKPVSTNIQFLRSQDVLLAQGAWQFDTGFAYTHFDNDFPVGLTNVATGDLNGVVEGHVRRRLLYTPLALRYGLTRNVQMFAALPMGFSNTQFSTVGTSDDTNSGGIGDLTAGFSAHLLKAEDQLPDVIATFGFTAPTGKFSTPLFGLVPGSNLGQGFWALAGQLLFIHTYDPIIVFYGGGYRHLFEREFDGVLFTPGEQINYQFGVGFAVNDRITLSTAFQGFYLTTFQLDHVTVRGTNIEPMSIRFAATIARNCRIIEPFVQIGVTDSAPNANLGLVVTFY